MGFRTYHTTKLRCEAVQESVKTNYAQFYCDNDTTGCIINIMSANSRSLAELLIKLRRMLPILRSQYRVRTLEVFGSFVRGEERADSDLDLLVTFDETPTLFRFVALENQLSDSLGIKVDLVMKDSLKPNIGKYILEEAQTI